MYANSLKDGGGYLHTPTQRHFLSSFWLAMTIVCQRL